MTGRVAKVLAMLNALSDEEKRELLSLMHQPPEAEPDIGVREPLSQPPGPMPPAGAAVEIPEVLSE